MRTWSSGVHAGTVRRLPEIEALARRVYDGLRHRDLDAIAASISRQDGLVWIGASPRQWWTSHDTMVRVIHDQLHPDSTVTLEDTDPQGYGEGDVGWVADQPRLRRPDGSELLLRLTAVAHREDGEWRFVQWHVSAGRDGAMSNSIDLSDQPARTQGGDK